jgi:hypothetical protein
METIASELGALLAGPEHAPAGTKRRSILLPGNNTLTDSMGELHLIAPMGLLSLPGAPPPSFSAEVRTNNTYLAYSRR